MTAITVFPLSAKLRRVCTNAFAAVESSPEVGSSKQMIEGDPNTKDNEGIRKLNMVAQNMMDQAN